MFSRIETAAFSGPRVSSFRTIILLPGYVRSPSNTGLPAPGLDNFPEYPGRGACPSPGSTPQDGESEEVLESALPKSMPGRRGSPACALRADPQLPAPPPQPLPAASLPVTAGAAASRAEADVGDRGEPPGRGGHVWASEGVQAEAGGFPGPAPLSRRLWGV